MPSITLTNMELGTYLLLVLSVISFWIRVSFPWAFWPAAATVCGYFAGILTGPAVVPIAILAGTCWFYGQEKTKTVKRPLVRGGLAIVILIVALLLGFNVFPGFHNTTVVDQIRLSPNSAPYTLRLSFGKIVAGILLLSLCYQSFIVTGKEWFEALRRSLPISTLNIVVILALALLLGFVRFEPKWSDFFWPWAIAMLFFTVMAEEAFFRGFIQNELQLSLKKYRFGQIIALVVAAVLFGLSHLGASATYIFLSILAGLGYGLAFQRSGRIEMSMLAHFALNTARFLLVTYPR